MSAAIAIFKILNMISNISTTALNCFRDEDIQHILPINIYKILITVCIFPISKCIYMASRSMYIAKVLQYTAIDFYEMKIVR